MKKALFILLTLFCVPTYAQYVVGNSFKAQTFGEMMAPLLMYRQAYKKAIAQFDDYFEKSQAAIENNNYSLAKTYLGQCEKINKRFKGNICSSKDLTEWITFCDNQIALQKQRQQDAKENKSCGVQYQTIRENVGCRITSVSANSSYTIIEFDYTNHYDHDGWCNIEPTAYIVDRVTNKLLKLLWAEGIPKSPEKIQFKEKYETIHFKLVFPAVSSTTAYIDIIESPNSSWRFYNVKIR